MNERVRMSKLKRLEDELWDQVTEDMRDYQDLLEKLCGYKPDEIQSVLNGKNEGETTLREWLVKHGANLKGIDVALSYVEPVENPQKNPSVRSSSFGLSTSASSSSRAVPKARGRAKTENDDMVDPMIGTVLLASSFPVRKKFSNE